MGGGSGGQRSIALAAPRYKIEHLTETNDSQALVPAFIYIFVRAGVFYETSGHLPESPASPDKPVASSSPQGSKSLLLILTLSGLAAIYLSSGAIFVVALGLCDAVALVWAYHLVGRASEALQDQSQNGGSVIYSANGLLTHPANPQDSGTPRWISLLRDVSVAAAVFTGWAALAFESKQFGELHYAGPPRMRDDGVDPWSFGLSFGTIILSIGAVIVHVGLFGALLLMVSPG